MAIGNDANAGMPCAGDAAAAVAQDSGVDSSGVDTDPDENPTDRPEPPRLRIHHIMLWTTITAVFVAIARWTFAQGPLLETNFFLGGILAFYLLYAMTAALAGTIFLLGIAWYQHGLAFFRQPGQWLASIYAVEAFCMVGSILLEKTYASGLLPPPPRFPEWLLPGLILGALIIAHHYGARWVADTKSWRLFFYLNTIRFGLAAVGFLIGFNAGLFMNPTESLFLRIILGITIAPPIGQFVSLVSLIIALRQDHRNSAIRGTRHWTHWAGSIAWSIALCCLILGAVAFFYWR